MKIGILASGNLMPDGDNPREDRFEFDEELAALTKAFATLKMAVEPVLWDESDKLADQYDAMLPLLVWDYFEGNETRFIETMERVADKTRLFNPPDTLRWNSDKRYLDTLATKGAPIIPTMKVDRVSEADAYEAFATFETNRLVIKPQIGGGAWRQVLYERDAPWPNEDALPPEGALIQPFLPSVQSEGEYSFLYFNGAFSHGLIKRAKAGDYRIQSLYGGTEEKYDPTPAEKHVAESVLDSLEQTPLYARVDLIRGLDNELKLIEIELIEPYLYFPQADIKDNINLGALALGKALRTRLDEPDH